MRVHEFSAYRTQGIITPVLHQGQLSSIEDHAYLEENGKEAWRETVEGAPQCGVTSLLVLSYSLPPSTCVSHPLPLILVTRNWNGAYANGVGEASSTHILIFKEIFLIATGSLPGYLQSEEKTSETITQGKAGRVSVGRQRDGPQGGLGITQKNVPSQALALIPTLLRDDSTKTV